MDTFVRRNHLVIFLFFILTYLSTNTFANSQTTLNIQNPSILPLVDPEALQTNTTKGFFYSTRPKDPITGFGHGYFFAPDGKTFELTPDSIYEAQAYYLTKLTDRVALSQDEKTLVSLKEKKAVIDKYIEDKILANALYLDELLRLSDKTQDTVLADTLDGLRRYYIQYFFKPDFELDAGLYSKGIRPEIAKELEYNGIIVFLKTKASGAQYIEECRDAGVPIPPPMYTAPWEHRGIFGNEFIDDSSFADLWFYESKDPEGACLALPRYPSEKAKAASLLGLICVGKKSSKACFWDSPNGVDFVRDVPVSIDKFLGGAALANNGQGTCTACHAGENPFIVHPDKPPFSGLTSKLMPNNWYAPLVDPSWPQNPGPISVLDKVSSEQRCDSCHQQGIAGRFPDVSDRAIAQYCSVVLEQSVFGGPKRTMPMGLGPIWPYFNHIDALLSLCYGDDNEIDPIPDDNGFLSPPIVIEPLYACATQVAVRGSLLDAKVAIYINGAFVASKISRNPSLLEFNVPALAVGDVVTAIQKFDGVSSNPSDPATVRDQKLDFPAGLPKPEIDPQLIYECGNTIAVHHVPGAKLTVFVNGGSPRSRNTSTGWSGIYPGKYPFDLGDEFTASIEMCGDTSPLSDIEKAVAAPLTVNAPKFDPPQTFVGQELINITDILNGAWVEPGEASAGSFGKFSTPVSWYSEYDFASKLGAPLAAGQHLFVQQALCDKGRRIKTPPAEECEGVPAPKIRIPLEGEDYVVVTEAVAGARIHVFDESNNELGDGSGSVIALNRALVANETITVTQAIGDCDGRYGYEVKVRRIEPQKKGD